MAIEGIYISNVLKENTSKLNTKCLTDLNYTTVKFLLSNLKLIPYNWNKFRKASSEGQRVSYVI